MSDRTFPAKGPQMKGVPTFSVPDSTITVAVVPRPGTTRASMTAARVVAFGLALSSSTSACRAMSSSRVSMPLPVTAETSANSVSPPKSVVCRPCSASCDFTRSTLADGRSHLLIATMVVFLDFLACLIASIVCGMMPSLAATTSTMMSVMSAPRARMSEKIAWPGVSRKVIS